MIWKEEGRRKKEDVMKPKKPTKPTQPRPLDKNGKPIPFGLGPGEQQDYEGMEKDDPDYIKFVQPVIESIERILAPPKKIWYTFRKSRRKDEAYRLGREIISGAQCGETLSIILSDLEIPYSKWIKLYKKSKKLQRDVLDASHFHRAYGQKQLAMMVKKDVTYNSVLAKLYLANFYDIGEQHKEPYIPHAPGKAPSDYTVMTQMIAVPEKVDRPIEDEEGEGGH